MKLKEELHELSVTNRALMLGRMPKKTSRYFMEGSTLIVMRGNSSPDAMVRTTKYHKDHNFSDVNDFGYNDPRVSCPKFFKSVRYLFYSNLPSSNFY